MRGIVPRMIVCAMAAIGSPARGADPDAQTAADAEEVEGVEEGEEEEDETGTLWDLVAGRKLGFGALHWGELYGEAIYDHRNDDNVIGMLDIKDGFRIAPIFGRDLILYGKLRAYKDANRDFWDNRAEVGPGLRIQPIPGLGLVAFGEYLFGWYYGIEGKDPNPYGSHYDGGSAGFLFWQRWGEPAPGVYFYPPFTGWREIYGDAIYFENLRDNVIANIQYKEGFCGFRLDSMPGDLYIRADAVVDRNADYWNNWAQGGIGLRIKPFETPEVYLAVEGLAGAYFGREGRDENPHDPAYFTVRVEMTLWHGW